MRTKNVFFIGIFILVNVFLYAQTCKTPTVFTWEGAYTGNKAVWKVNDTEQANKYYNEIFTAIDKICENSDTGKPIDEIKKGHRRTNVKSHMIIYKVKGKTIYIDRILHQKMDIEKQLFE